jgi:hypothetical protein
MRQVSVEGEPLKRLPERAIEISQEALRDRDLTQIRQSFDNFWIRFIPDKQLCEMMSIRALSWPATQVGMVLFFVAGAIFRIAVKMPASSYVWAIEFTMFSCIIAALVPPFHIGSFNYLRETVLLTPVPRRKLMHHVGYLVAYRSFVVIVLGGVLLSPWGKENLVGLFSAILLIWGAYVMNIANTAWIQITLRIGSRGRGDVPSAGYDIGVSFAAFMLYVFLQALVLPLTIYLIKCVDWNKGILTAPHPAVLIGLAAYAVLYYFTVISYAAKMLEKEEQDYCETAFYL